MQLRYLQEIALYKTTRKKQPNGSYIDSYDFVKAYETQEQELTDDVSVSMYGADIRNITRIKSIKGELEAYLKPLMVSEEDNISKYIIVLNGLKYSVKTVKSYVDIMLIGKFENTNQSL